MNKLEIKLSNLPKEDQQLIIDFQQRFDINSLDQQLNAFRQSLQVQLLNNLFNLNIILNQPNDEENLYRLISSLSNHFQSKAHDLKVFTQHYQRIFNITEQKSSRREGFKVDSDESEAEINSKRQKDVSKRPVQNSRQQSKVEDKQVDIDKDQKIRELEQKLQAREQIISDLREGYQKDVSHFKEMLQRQANNQEVHEVIFFDEFANFDQNTKEIVNKKMAEQQVMYQKKISEVTAKLKTSEEEKEKLMKTIKSILDQSNSSSLLKQIIQRENSVYKIWKLLQDNIGNKQIFEIFENRRHEFGINYNEVDSFLQKSQAAYRMYQHYKIQIEESMSNLIERTSNLTNELQLNYDAKCQAYEELEAKFETYQVEVLDQNKQLIFEQVKAQQRQIEFSELKLLVQEQIEKTPLFAPLFDQLIKAIKRSTLRTWLILAKYKKFQNNLQNFMQTMSKSFNLDDCQCIIKALEDCDLKPEVENNQIRQEEESQQQLKKILELEEELRRVDADLCNLKIKHQLALDKIGSIEFKHFTQQNYVVKLKSENKIAEARMKLYEQCIQMVTGKYLEKGADNKDKLKKFYSDFQHKIDQIYSFKGELIDEIVFQHQRNMQTFNKIFDKSQTSNREVMTDIFDVNQTLSYIEEREGLKRAIDAQEKVIDLLKHKLIELRQTGHQFQLQIDLESKKLQKLASREVGQTQQTPSTKLIPEDNLDTQNLLDQIIKDKFMVDSSSQTDPTIQFTQMRKEKNQELAHKSVQTQPEQIPTEQEEFVQWERQPNSRLNQSSEKTRHITQPVDTIQFYKNNQQSRNIRREQSVNIKYRKQLQEAQNNTVVDDINRRMTALQQISQNLDDGMSPNIENILSETYQRTSGTPTAAAFKLLNLIPYESPIVLNKTPSNYQNLRKNSQSSTRYYKFRTKLDDVEKIPVSRAEYYFRRLNTQISSPRNDKYFEEKSLQINQNIFMGFGDRLKRQKSKSLVQKYLSDK